MFSIAPASIVGSLDPLGRVVLISLSVGFALIGLIYAFGDISGAHFNRRGLGRYDCALPALQPVTVRAAL